MKIQYFILCFIGATTLQLFSAHEDIKFTEEQIKQPTYNKKTLVPEILQEANAKQTNHKDFLKEKTYPTTYAITEIISHSIDLSFSERSLLTTAINEAKKTKDFDALHDAAQRILKNHNEEYDEKTFDYAFRRASNGFTFDTITSFFKTQIGHVVNLIKKPNISAPTSNNGNQKKSTETSQDPQTNKQKPASNPPSNQENNSGFENLKLETKEKTPLPAKENTKPIPLTPHQQAAKLSAAIRAAQENTRNALNLFNDATDALNAYKNTNKDYHPETAPQDTGSLAYAKFNNQRMHIAELTAKMRRAKNIYEAKKKEESELRQTQANLSDPKNAVSAFDDAFKPAA